MRFNRLLWFPFALTLSVQVNALTLQESVSEVLETNPTVVERLKNYRASKAKVGVADAGYMPTIDLETSVGREEGGVFFERIDRTGDWVLEHSLILRQNLFDGFGTVEQVNYEKMQTLAAAHSYLEVANDTSLKMIKSYLDVLREYELLINARDNVQEHQKIYDKVLTLYNGGLTTLSEVERIKASLSSVEANLILQKNSVRDAQFSLKRILGRLLTLEELEVPNYKPPMPDSLDQASAYALKYNPSLQVSRFNIKSAQSLLKQDRKNFYPTLDAELSANFDDYAKNENARQDDQEYYRAMLVLRYNLYRGGSDSAKKQINISKINQEVAIQQDLRRQTLESLALAWNSRDLSIQQIPILEDYYLHSKRTLGLYIDEYNFGKRSLLDLLAAQNDVARSNTQIIDANYKLLYSEYRIMDAMGLTMAAVVGDVNKYYQNVGLRVDEEAQAKMSDEEREKAEKASQDTLPIKNDMDNDHIVDSKDLCDNSEANTSVRALGCVRFDDGLDALDTATANEPTQIDNIK